MHSCSNCRAAVWLCLFVFILCCDANADQDVLDRPPSNFMHLNSYDAHVGFAWHPDGKEVFCMTEKGYEVWDVQFGRRKTKRELKDDIRFWPDKKYGLELRYSTSGSEVLVQGSSINVATGEVTRRFSEEESWKLVGYAVGGKTQAALRRGENSRYRVDVLNYQDGLAAVPVKHEFSLKNYDYIEILAVHTAPLRLVLGGGKIRSNDDSSPPKYTVLVYGVDNGNIEREWTSKHKNRVNCWAYNENTSTLATGGQDDGFVCLYRLGEDSAVQVLNAHQNSVLSIAFATSGERLVSFGGDGTRAWNTKSGMETWFAPYFTTASRCAVSADSTMVIACSDRKSRNTIDLIDFATGKRKGVFSLNTPSGDDALALAWSKDGKTLFYLTEKACHSVSLANGKSSTTLVKPVTRRPTSFESAVYDSRSGYFAIIDEAGDLSFFNPYTGEMKGVDLHYDPFERDSVGLLTTGGARSGPFWDAGGVTAGVIVEGFRDPKSQSSTYLWMVDRQGLQFRSQDMTFAMPSERAEVVVRASPNGQSLALGFPYSAKGEKGVIKLVDMKTRSVVHELLTSHAGRHRRIHDIRFSADGKLILALLQNESVKSANESLRAWSTHNGAPINVPEFGDFGREVSRLGLSDSGNTLAVGAEEQTVIMKVADDSIDEMRRLDWGIRERNDLLALSPDGRLIAFHHRGSIFLFALDSE